MNNYIVDNQSIPNKERDFFNKELVLLINVGIFLRYLSEKEIVYLLGLYFLCKIKFDMDSFNRMMLARNLLTLESKEKIKKHILLIGFEKELMDIEFLH